MAIPTDSRWGPEQGVEPRYDCPECEYRRTGVTTSRHGFTLHLLKDHDYTLDDVARLISPRRRSTVDVDHAAHTGRRG